MYLEFKTNSGTFRLDFTYPLNLIIGDSSTGKSELVKELKRCRKSIIRSDASEIITELNAWSVPVLPSNSIILLDMDTMSSSDVVDAIAVCDRDDCCFILLGRKYARRLTVAICNTFKLQDVRGVTKNIPFLENELLIKRKFNKVYVEDSKSGLDFFTNVFSNCTSTDGAPGVLKRVVDCEDNESLLILDTVGFGAYIEEFLQYIKCKTKISVLGYKSFEHLILETLFNYNTLPKCVNIEKGLVSVLRDYVPGYSKKSGCSGRYCTNCANFYKQSSTTLFKKSKYSEYLDLQESNEVPNDFEQWCLNNLPEVFKHRSVLENWEEFKDLYEKY